MPRGRNQDGAGQNAELVFKTALHKDLNDYMGTIIYI